MFDDVLKLPQGQPCRIAGYGYTELGQDCQYDNRRFIREILSQDGRAGLYQYLGCSDPTKLTPDQEDRLIELADAKFVSATGIASRYIFPGTTAELGAMAARVALTDAGWPAADLDAIIVATNTGRGYPSTADMIKLHLGERSTALCYDLTEACSAGLAAVFDAWRGIRSGAFRRLLVVGTENALGLASRDNYKECNLFGSAGFALALEATGPEQFRFFDQISEPFDGQAEWIRKDPHGFTQEGRRVHEYVGRVISQHIAEKCAQAGINPTEIRHLFLHMPSRKTLDLLVERLRRHWPSFTGLVHENVSTHGNTSAASVGWLIARAKASQALRSGELCVAWAFGSGMSAAGMAFDA